VIEPPIQSAAAPAPTPGAAPDPTPAAAAALAAALAYARGADAAETRRAYAGDWRGFTTWCATAGLAPLPAAPETVASFLAAHAKTHALATLRRRLAAIARAHRQAGHEFWPGHPAIRGTLRGIARAHATPPRQAAALTTAEIRRLVAPCGPDAAGLRDRALLLIGYAGALRRSELAAIAREDLGFDAAGLRLTLPRSKADPEAAGAILGIPRGRHAATCPVRALEAWLAASGCEFGPVFRKVDRWGGIETRALHPDAIRQILRRRAAEAGLDTPVSPHGLRAGFVTEAYRAGLRDEEIMGHTRHRDLASMRRYVRRARLLDDSPARRLGL